MKKTSCAVPLTLVEAIRHFADPDVSLEFLASLRWPDGVTCPHCAAEKPMFLKTRRIWKCRSCRKQFSVKVGTVFEDSPLGLDKWLPALWLLANAKNGVSSYELARSLGITQKTAWFMLGRIRLAMESKSFEKLEGEVEIDETFIGGKSQNMHKSRRHLPQRLGAKAGMSKTAVLGMLQRSEEKGGSRVRALVVEGVKRSHLIHDIESYVEECSAVYTDSLQSYRNLSARYAHENIDHSREWAKGRVHTNGLENFWSVLKRGIKGTYISIDPFHAFRYVGEQSFRFNLRQLTDGERFKNVARDIVGKRLTYRALIGADLATT